MAHATCFAGWSLPKIIVARPKFANGTKVPPSQYESLKFLTPTHAMLFSGKA
jgi:hypothetical protein